MALRITDIVRDLPRINTEFARFDLHQQQIEDIRSQVGQLQKHLLTEEAKIAPAQQLGQNNITFTWTGATLTISWGAGYVFSNGHYLPVPAGSTTGVANTYYWMAWNPKQQTMSRAASLNTILALPNTHNLLILAQIFTGTGAQAGALGGGGTEPGGGVGINMKQYKLF